MLMLLDPREVTFVCYKSGCSPGQTQTQREGDQREGDQRGRPRALVHSWLVSSVPRLIDGSMDIEERGCVVPLGEMFTCRKMDNGQSRRPPWLTHLSVASYRHPRARACARSIRSASGVPRSRLHGFVQLLVSIS